MSNPLFKLRLPASYKEKNATLVAENLALITRLSTRQSNYIAAEVAFDDIITLADVAQSQAIQISFLLGNDLELSSMPPDEGNTISTRDEIRVKFYNLMAASALLADLYKAEKAQRVELQTLLERTEIDNSWRYQGSARARDYSSHIAAVENLFDPQLTGTVTRFSAGDSEVIESSSSGTSASTSSSAVGSAQGAVVTYGFDPSGRSGASVSTQQQRMI